MGRQIATIPLKKIRQLQIYVNQKKKTLAQIKQETGADYVLNGGLFNPDWTACPLLKAEGVLYSKTPWRACGFGWDGGGDISLRLDYENVRNFISCVCLLRGGKRESLSALPAALGGARQRSAIGLDREGRLVLWCTDQGTTPAALQGALEALGCTDAVMLDGGGSSQCDFAGAHITSSRVVHNLILVWTDKEGPPLSEKKIVCLDPGHGPETVNGSPDGSYKEKEFAWNMYTRIKPLLEGQGIQVVGTRNENTMPSLTERAEVSNRAGADLFVSLHSNAAGNDGWYDASGFLIYTSSGPESAPRNQAALAILAQARAAGIEIRGTGLLHEGYTVLTKTTAPAVLIEFGFHTDRDEVELLKSDAYRAKLAEAVSRGICDFLGVRWTEEGPEQTPEPPVPQGDAPDTWAAEAWRKAAEKGVLDGTRPREALTRQELAVVLDRLGLL